MLCSATSRKITTLKKLPKAKPSKKKMTAKNKVTSIIFDLILSYFGRKIKFYDRAGTVFFYGTVIDAAVTSIVRDKYLEI